MASLSLPVRRVMSAQVEDKSCSYPRITSIVKKTRFLLQYKKLQVFFSDVETEYLGNVRQGGR